MLNCVSNETGTDISLAARNSLTGYSNALLRNFTGIKVVHHPLDKFPARIPANITFGYGDPSGEEASARRFDAKPYAHSPPALAHTILGDESFPPLASEQARIALLPETHLVSLPDAEFAAVRLLEIRMRYGEKREERLQLPSQFPNLFELARLLPGPWPPTHSERGEKG
ncbi:hypothetical protein GCM10010331_44940 [Streptomyces xanthochromogenes]|nr:hypothetical protein GCM10010331_44940 [Streptomyces xanthochromogenes]